MRPTEVCRAWVVYRMTLPKGAVAGNVVCEQHEWDALEAQCPGYHKLLHTGIKTEQEAEKLARGTAGDDYRQRRPRGKKAAPPATPFLFTTSTT